DRNNTGFPAGWGRPSTNGERMKTADRSTDWEIVGLQGAHKAEKVGGALFPLGNDAILYQ
ncbi:MAG: hypothetical protein J7555_10745, partial [Chloroflexi bacterium]|nr:hypothetical protein [Chloroflexota bacterium]